MSEEEIFTNTESDDSATQYVVEQVDTDEKIPYGISSQIGYWIQRQNVRKDLFKKLAYRIFGGTLIGLAYLYAGKEQSLNIDVMIIIGVFSLVSSIVIDAAWFLNHGVYHREIAVLYDIVTSIEQQDEDDRGFSNMGKLLHAKHTDPSVFDIIIYSLPSLSLKIVGLLSLVYYVYEVTQELKFEVFALVFSVLILCSFIFIATWYSRNTGNPRRDPTKTLKRSK